MKIGLIDCDNWSDVQNEKVDFPNLPLMKLSAWHKNQGDSVEWFNPDHEYDEVYKSKVFTFSEDPFPTVNCIKGGTGFATDLIDGIEHYRKERDPFLPEEIEHIYPDYSLYGISETAFGYLTRGCPRHCKFCCVGDKDGTKCHKHADLSEFWHGQKNIVLLDGNITAYKDWKPLFQQLIDSKSKVDFSQGLDIRLLTLEQIEYLNKMKLKTIHFAWDRFQDGSIIKPKLAALKQITDWTRSNVIVYVLTNFDTTIQQDLERVEYIRSLNFQPYIMRYQKNTIPNGSVINALARWVNFVPLFWKYSTFEDYWKHERKGEYPLKELT